MATVLSPVPPFHAVGPVDYPERDGLPMSDNTLQFQWIVTIQGGLDALYADRLDVFVAGDLLWYPVEGDNKTRAAPDAMVVFGRPKGHRGSYRQWEEDHLPPQVVFEVLSPGNTFREMLRKFRFYERFGVLEYYLYDPDHPTLSAWRRADASTPLEEIEHTDGWRSPLLDIVFEFDPAGQLRIVRPDGRPFETFVQLSQRADAERQRADTERQRADSERQRADAERQRATTADERAEAERQRADALAARLRAAGLDPAAGA